MTHNIASKLMLRTEQFETLKLARYEIHLRAKHSVVLPPLLGSTLRGAFGHAWKTLMCAASPGERAGCFLVEQCQLPANCRYSFFKPPPRLEMKEFADGSLREKRSSLPCSYVFEPLIPPITPEISVTKNLDLRVPEGGQIPFWLTLLDVRSHSIKDVFSAVGLMAKRGLGGSRVPFSLTRVYVLDEADKTTDIFDPSSGKLVSHSDHMISLDRLVVRRLSEIKQTDRLTLRFLTPVALETGGKLKKTFTFFELMSYLSRRLVLLSRSYGSSQLEVDHDHLKFIAHAVETRSRQLWLHESQRYSGSSGGKLDQDGLLGEVTFEGKGIVELLPLLVAGEFLHVGSNTAFGLGRYLIVS